MIKISPSVLSADLSRLAEEVKEIELAGADMVHLDVMDGMFVKNITFGFPVISCLRKTTDIIFDVHLMINSPERYIDQFVKAGADIITFHLEACSDPRAALLRIRELGCKSAISIKPNTPIEMAYEFLDFCDMVLVMTTEPGYSGQTMIPECLDKVSLISKEIKRRGLPVAIQVDGGINFENASLAVAAGATVLVAGTAVFGAADRAEAIKKLKGAQSN